MATVKGSTKITVVRPRAKVLIQAPTYDFRVQLNGSVLPASIVLATFIENIEHPKYKWFYLNGTEWVVLTSQVAANLTVVSGTWTQRYYRVEVQGYTTASKTIESTQFDSDYVSIRKSPYDAQLEAELNIIKATTDKMPVSIQGSLLMGSNLFLRNVGDKNDTGLENAGASGINTPATNPAFWAGGNYLAAVAGTAKAIIRHDGSSKFTDTEIEGKITAIEGYIGGFGLADRILSTPSSGLSGDNDNMKNPVFWGGGSYEQAQRFQLYLDAIKNNTPLPTGLANFVVNHDGAIKAGSLLFDSVGTGVIINPVTKKPSFILSPFDIPSLSDLLETTPVTIASTKVNNVTKTVNKTTQTVDLPNTINVTRGGSTINFDGAFTFAFNHTQGPTAKVNVDAVLLKDGVEFTNLYYNGRMFYVGEGGFSGSHNETVSVELTGVPKGVYKVRLIASFVAWTGTASLQVGASTMSWSHTGSSADRVHIGRNGFTSFYGNKYVYFSSTEGWKTSEDVVVDEREGVTCRATISSGGSVVNQRGAVSITASKGTMGKYTITHGLNTKSYSIHLSTNTIGAIASYTNRQTTFFDVEIVSSEFMSPLDTEFDVTITS